MEIKKLSDDELNNVSGGDFETREEYLKVRALAMKDTQKYGDKFFIDIVNIMHADKELFTIDDYIVQRNDYLKSRGLEKD